MNGDIFSADAKFAPYWWEAAPRPDLPRGEPPRNADIAVVGSGYSGLAAALTLARAGRDVVVFEAGDVGHGASTRNGGMCGDLLRLSLAELTQRHGTKGAAALIAEARRALDYVADFIAREGIDCHFARTGRFTGAHKPGRYESLARETEVLSKDFGFEAYMVPRAEQHGEIGSDIYYGGRVMAHHGGLHPALYHQGLLDRALEAGVTVLPHARVISVAPDEGGFVVATPRGRLDARDVIVATNGYTDPALPEFRRRVIPIASSIIATEPVDREVMARLMPKGRMITDSRINLSYYRPSPDGSRLLFGGRASVQELDPRVSGARLYKVMTEVFPELAGVAITHSWSGFVAYAFDRLPHTGVRDGVHYAMAYCGSGVVMATYLGHKTALRILGDADAATAFDGRDFPGRPFHFGTPWFLPLASAWYTLVDRFGR